MIGRIIDVVKIDIGFAFLGDLGIEVADRARSGIARVFQRLGCRLVVFFQHGKTDHRLAAHLRRALVGYLQRERGNGECLRRYVLALHAVAARCRTDKRAFIVRQTNGKPVEFVFHRKRRIAARRLFCAGGKGAEFLLRYRFIQAKQSCNMRVFFKPLDRLAAHTAGGAVGIYHAAFLFQRAQFVV